MASSITVAFMLLVGCIAALSGGRRHGLAMQTSYSLITPTPYNNPHSDATAASDERALMLG